MKLIIVALATLISFSQALASDDMVFVCKSLPNVDSELTVVGVADELTSDINLVFMVAGQVIAQDQGVMIEGTTRYEGIAYDMQFDHITTITGKQEATILGNGQSDSLICEFPGLN